MIIVKFGGAALADSANILHCAEYVARIRERNPVVVVSAMKGVTDVLIETIDLAVKNSYKRVCKNLKVIREMHEDVLRNLLSPGDAQEAMQTYVTGIMDGLYSVYKSLEVINECPPKIHDRIVSSGEKVSSRLFASVLQSLKVDAVQIEGEQIIVTDGNFTSAQPCLKQTAIRTKEKLLPLVSRGITPVAAGFTGANTKGETTTIGRGGTDLTASVLASCLDAEEVWFMKEVDGIMSADPKIVGNAKTVERLTYREVAELSHFGAKILHPVAIHPLKDKKIPSFVRNVYNPDCEGTRIAENGKCARHAVKAVTCVRDVSIVKVQYSGITCISGIAGRIFTALGAGRINSMLITHSSSEQNIIFVIRRSDADKAVALLSREFELEILKKEVGGIRAENHVSIVSVVGEGIRKIPGIQGNIFSALEEEHIEMKLAAQGSSDLNITLIVPSADVDKAINSIHNKIKASEEQ